MIKGVLYYVRTTAVVAAMSLSLVGVQTKAATIVDLSSYGIGLITPTIIPPSGLDSTYLVNMINTYNSGVNATIGSQFYAIHQGSGTPNPVLPAPPASVLDTGVSGSPTSHDIDLGPSGAGLYLIAQWDGPQGADAVYYIGGLTGVITLENTVDVVNANGGPYGLSGYWLASGTDSVPDGGVTAVLLGFALVGIESLRRKLAKA